MFNRNEEVKYENGVFTSANQDEQPSFIVGSDVGRGSEFRNMLLVGQLEPLERVYEDENSRSHSNEQADTSNFEGRFSTVMTERD